MTKRMRILIVCLLAGVPASLGAQSLAVKTNLLYWGTGTINAGVEASLTERITLHVTGGYNPIKLKATETSTPSLEHMVVDVEGRWWMCSRFDGTFFGAQAFYGNYKIEDVPLIKLPKTHRYEGTGFGAGVVVGNHWAIGRRWGLEASVGAGMVMMQYDKMLQNQGETLGKFKQTYFGPTKVNISFMYFIR
jgi:hypothetical protein